MTEPERLELRTKIQALLKAIWIDEQEMKLTHDLLICAGGLVWVPKREAAQELAGQTEK